MYTGAVTAIRLNSQIVKENDRHEGKRTPKENNNNSLGGEGLLRKSIILGKILQYLKNIRNINLAQE